ncbi:MAG: HlyD family efflux transporter periplasmic adaptor subunit [Bacteroidota bacterium]|nr:HlyD family efflux transporter periplasmic adaptor subunit [Bacteroidota bacterium]
MKMQHVYWSFLIAVATVSCNHVQETKPERKDIIDAVFASGNIISTNEFVVTANAEGFLQQSFVAEGDSVKKDEVLFRLANDVQQTQVNNAATNYDYARKKAMADGPQIQELEVQIMQAKQQCNTDSLNYARYQRLVKTKAVAEVDFEKMKLQYQNSVSALKMLEQSLANLETDLAQSTDNAKSQLVIQQQSYHYNNLTSAITGTVLNVYKKPGDFVKKGEPVARVGAGILLAKLFISEDDIQRVRVGQDLVIALNTDKQKNYQARISKIYPAFDSDQQAFVAEATFVQLPSSIKSNTQLQANIIVGEKKNALVIPSNYIDKDGEVMLKDNDKRVPVKIGISNLEWTEIVSGINEKEVIILPKS